MGVRLSIEIVSPLEPDDRELLTGLSIMVMAIANHELAKEHFPGTFPSPEEMAEEARQAGGRTHALHGPGQGPRRRQVLRQRGRPQGSPSLPLHPAPGRGAELMG